MTRPPTPCTTGAKREPRFFRSARKKKSPSLLVSETTYVGNEILIINVGSGGGGITQQDLDDAINPIMAANDGQNLIITDININLAKNFQTTTQLKLDFIIRHR